MSSGTPDQGKLFGRDFDPAHKAGWRMVDGVSPRLATLIVLVTLLAACSPGKSSPKQTGAASLPQRSPVTIATIGNMPPVVDPSNIYTEATAGKLSEVAAAATPRVYVPGHGTGNVTVIDPATLRVIGVLGVGLAPQHVVPSWDLATLWVANNADGTNDGSLTPIDARTGTAGPAIAVEDPYNLYFTPDGAYALVVAEARRRLDSRNPLNMALRFSISTPSCAGINHMDFSADGRYLVATCEDASRLIKVDWMHRTVVATLDLGAGTLPQDVRLSPNGRTFYVADMQGNRLIMVDGDTFASTGSVDLAASGGIGAHGIYPSRDGTVLYVANRGSAARGTGPTHPPGGVSVVDVASNRVVSNWLVPGGGSPDMGGVTADGGELWLSGRFDNEVYVFDTRTGRLLSRIALPAGSREPHGLCVWPQPGRYSLGHTGNTR